MTPKKSLASSIVYGDSEKSLTQEEGSQRLGLLTSRTIRNVVVYKQPSLRYFLMAAQNDQHNHVLYTRLRTVNTVIKVDKVLVTWILQSTECRG